MATHTGLYEGLGVSFSYDRSLRETRVLDQLDFRIEGGETLCLAGPSGSGKSTLLNLLGTIERPQLGTLLFQGQDLATLSEESLCRIRRNDIGFIFQDFQLIEVLSVEENIEYFLHRQGVPTIERKKRVKDALGAVGMTGYEKRHVTELSGGQRQRVAIARAIAKNPAVIIADEPTANLDLATGRQIMKTLQSLQAERPITLIIASHDTMVLEHASQVMHIQDGKIAPSREVSSRVS